VSVVLIFLNEQRFLPEAIESVIAQTSSDWELLLVDDGSMDGSSEIAQAYAGRDQRIRYLAHAGKRNRGKSTSRNVGIEHARGEFIVFLDGDDILRPTKIERQASALLERRASIGYGRTLYWYNWPGSLPENRSDYISSLGVAGDRVYQPPILLTLFLQKGGYVPCLCGLMLRRTLALQVGGFDERIQNLYEDQTFIAKLCAEFPVLVQEDCWEEYRQHRNSTSYAAIASGEYHPRRKTNPARLAFLTWLASYLDERKINDEALRRTLARAYLPFRFPRFYNISLRGENAVRRVKRTVVARLERIQHRIYDSLTVQSINRATLDSLLDGWQIQKPIRARNLRGSGRPKMLISSSQADFVLECCGPAKEKETMIEFRATIAKAVRAHGFAYSIPACEEIKGLPYQQKAGNTWILYKRLRGDSIGTEWPEDSVFQLGQMVGEFSVAAAHASRGTWNDLDFLDPGAFARDTELMVHLPFLRAKRESQVVAGLICDLLTNYARPSVAFLERLLEMPKIPTVGNWNPLNVVTNGQVIIGLRELDGLRLAAKVYDVANALLECAATRFAFEEERVRNFFRGYESKSPISDIERETLPVVLLDRLLASVSSVLKARRRDVYKEQSSVSRMIRLSHWLTRNDRVFRSWIQTT
jgi:glycosyltransferase involved in cell wall biosynthesis/Ser/Thr protein kinase RdoA (MazF antagonist)